MGEDNFIIALVPEIKAFGIIQATLINKIRGWIKLNTEQKRYNFADRYWSGHISTREFMEQTGLPQSTIKENIKKLCNLGILFCGTHNKLSYDRTRWYWIDEDQIIKLCAGREPAIPGREPSEGKNSIFEEFIKEPTSEKLRVLNVICGPGFDVYFSKSDIDSIVRKYHSKIKSDFNQEQFKFIINQIKNN
jgi:hypothetical protein